jgi:hypothetical protein
MDVGGEDIVWQCGKPSRARARGRRGGGRGGGASTVDGGGSRSGGGRGRLGRWGRLRRARVDRVRVERTSQHRGIAVDLIRRQVEKNGAHIKPLAAHFLL